jgi:predicted nucleic acid-binding protein
MAASVIVDASFLVTLLSRRESNHRWAAAAAQHHPPPWLTCEAVLSETFHLLGSPGTMAVTGLIRARALDCVLQFDTHRELILRLMEKYADIPMSFADACLVRMTEVIADPVVLTTDADFRLYRRHGRQVIPVMMP